MLEVDQARLNLGGNVWLVDVLLALIMFGVALDLRLSDFTRVVAKPRAPLTGLLTQIFLMPALAFLLVLLLRPAPGIALGMILVAACPSGNMSNFITHIAGGNTALSVTVTAFSTLLAAITTPLNIAFWGSLLPETAAILREVALSWTSLAGTVGMILVLPLFLGIAFASQWPLAAKRLHTPFKLLSVAFLLIFIAVATVQNFDTFRQYAALILLAVFLENTLALLVGYGVSRAAQLPTKDVRALTIEVGIHNSALGLTLILGFFDGLGGMALVAGTWSIWHIASGMLLASFWHYRDRTAPPAQSTA